MKKVTFIHAADLHLDSPMVGLKHLPGHIYKRLQESTFTSLEKIINAAIEHNVDFVVFAGDLFDGEDRSIRAQTKLRHQLERLNEVDIPVFIIHGNHDHLGGRWAQFPYPENTFIFSSEFSVKTITTENDATVSIYGFSYPKRHVTERRIDEYQRKEGADFHIALLHGSVEGNREHGIYAPFTIAELLEKGFDYWALGHIHKRTLLAEEPPIIYPGNIQGRHRKESGEKGCYLVTLTDQQSRLEFISTADCIWECAEVDVQNEVTVADIYQICRKKIESERKDGVGILLSLLIKNLSLSGMERELFSKEELLELFQDEEKEEQTSFVWPIDLEVEEIHHWNREQLVAESDFYQELFREIDTFVGTTECVAPLYQNPAVRKFLELPGEDDSRQLVREAEQLLVELLKKS